MSTEIAVLRLDRQMDVGMPFFAKDGGFKKILKEITNFPSYSAGFWGVEDEDHSVLRVFIEWDSTSIVEAENYIPLNEKFASLPQIISSECFLVDFKPFEVTKPLDPKVAGNTMVETIYFDGSFPHADGWSANFKQKVANIIRERGDVFKAAAGGWAVNRACVRDTEEECHLWFAVVGWPSMAAHLEWRDSPSHLENQKLLEQYKDWWRGLIRVHSSMHSIEEELERVDSSLSRWNRAIEEVEGGSVSAP